MGHVYVSDNICGDNGKLVVKTGLYGHSILRLIFGRYSFRIGHAVA
jgi:hypothetical protein